MLAQRRQQRPHPLSLKRFTTKREEPTSPATTTYSSLSWAAEKSAAELTVLLKNAHASLHEKEKDLTLAAEIGHYLLENNMTLKQQYEALLQQQLQQQREIEENECSVIQEQHDDDYGYDAYNDSSFYLLSQQQSHQRVLGELQDRNMELQRLLEDAQQQTDKLQVVHDKKARELQYDITLLKDHLDMASQKIEELEVDRSVKQRRQHRHTHRLSPCHDEQQKDDLVTLEHRIEQLENENQRLVHTRQSVQQRLNKALYDVEALQSQFNPGQWTRESYTQLNDAYQRQFNHIAQLNVSLEEHRHLLSNLTEYGDGVLINIKDNNNNNNSNNNNNNNNSDSNNQLALSHSSSSVATTLESHLHYDYDEYDIDQDEHCFDVCDTTNNNLMAELEKAWHRDQLTMMTPDLGTTTYKQEQVDHRHCHQGFTDKAQDEDDGYASLPHSTNDFFHGQPDLYHFTDDSCFYSKTADYINSQRYHSHYTMNHADVDNGDNGDNGDHDNHDEHDDLLFGPLDASDLVTYNLYPSLAKNTSTGLTLHQDKEPFQPILGIAYKVQRWCRFAVVLTMAVVINVFEGPDVMLEGKY